MEEHVLRKMRQPKNIWVRKHTRDLSIPGFCNGKENNGMRRSMRASTGTVSKYRADPKEGSTLMILLAFQYFF